MKLRLPLALVIISVVARADATLPIPIQNALTTIDTVPTSGQLDTLFADQDQDALTGLTTIAQDPGTDTGVRLRAINALTSYCATSPCVDGDIAHQTLISVISANAEAQSGSGVVLLRGAIEAVGPQRVGTDLALLVPLLDHPSRDIRAATAHALRDLCNTQAINPLRVRYSNETTDQVRLAISEALRILGQPSPCQ